MTIRRIISWILAISTLVFSPWLVYWIAEVNTEGFAIAYMSGLVLVTIVLLFALVDELVLYVKRPHDR